MAILATNVRGSSGFGKSFVKLDNGFLRENSVKDIGAFLDWIDSRSDFNQEKIAVFGGSYGGYMVLASMTHYNDRLSCAVDVVGISNFVTFLKNTKNLNNLRKQTVDWVMNGLNSSKNKYLNKQFWMNQSDNLYLRGKAEGLADTKRARMPSFFEASNQNLPKYG